VRRLLDDPDAVWQRIGQVAFNAERARRLSVWWQAARPLRNKWRGCAAFRGLTSGPARWLMSRATSHMAAAGLCLSKERRQGLDTCQHRTLTHAGVLLVLRSCQGPDLTRRDLGPTRGTRHAFLGTPDLYVQGFGVLLLRSDPMMHPGMYHLSLPRGALGPAYVAGSGAVLHVAWKRRTCTTSSYYRRGYP
jgi:hypothetical protein